MGTQVPKKLDPTIGGDGETPLKVIWYNMRQEPVVYLDGVPYAPRHPVSEGSPNASFMIGRHFVSIHTFLQMIRY